MRGEGEQQGAGDGQPIVNHKRRKPRRKVRGPGYSERPFGNAPGRAKKKYRATLVTAVKETYDQTDWAKIAVYQNAAAAFL